MSLSRLCRVVGLSLVCAILAVPLAAAGVEAGKVRLRTDFSYAGKVFAKGWYEVQLETTADGPAIALLKDGVVVVRELAVVEAGKSARRRAGSAVRINKKDDARVIVTVRHETNRYIAFFDSAG